MAVYYFESFDTMAVMDIGLDGGGDQDTAWLWSNSSFQRHYFDNENGKTNQSIVVDETMYMGISVLPDYDRVVVGGDFKLYASNNEGGTIAPYVLSVGEGTTDGPTNMIILQTNSDGDLTLKHNTTTIGTTLDSILSSSTWTNLTLDVDQANGIIKLYVNGALQQTVTETISAFSGSGLIAIGRQPVGLTFLQRFIGVDNFWIADALWNASDGDIMGIQVAATQDKYTSGGSSGLVGTLMFRGKRYEGSPISAKINSGSYSPGDNVGTKTNWLWNTTPLDEDWTESRLDQISHWGVCCIPDTGPTDMRLINVCLEVLRWNNGKPIVYSVMPGPAAYFSGDWTKSDDTLAYFAHVNKRPRDDDQDIADVTYLTSHTYGCMLFEFRPPPEQPEPPDPLEEVGITFAEERRTDYVDWKDLLGHGEDYVSYFISGYSLAGQGDKFFSNNYLTINYKNVTGGGAYAQGVWDFSSSSLSSRWSQKQLVYSPSRITGGHYTHGARKLLIRGQGRSLQVRISSLEGQPFEINGWTMYLTGNSKA